MPLVPRHIQELESYRPGRNILEVRKELGLDHIIKLASNENPYGPSPKALKAVTGSLRDIFRYPDVSAIELREKLVNTLGYLIRVSCNLIQENYLRLRLHKL